jgi:predicted CXXCH cytochrome family protein
MLAWTLVVLTLTAVLLASQLARIYGVRRGPAAALALVALVGALWWLLERSAPTDAAPEDWATVASVPAEACAKCHAEHYASWRRTFHRTMTREATAENVKGDFNDAEYAHRGIVTHLSRAGDQFFMETVDPGWALLRAQAKDLTKLPPPRHVKVRVDRLVGSHWIQECLHADDSGRYRRLPVLYHIGEKRWIHTSGAFLTPDDDDFWAQSRATTWNDSCLYCHNTGPSQNPIRGPKGQIVGYRTTVAELGISCEACHGPGATHVELNRNPARRLALREASAGDPSIVHPERLSVPRRDDICARCHGALVPKQERWDFFTHRDPFIAGQELTRFNSFFWSEAEQAKLNKASRTPGTEPIDGRFWGDGTPLTTALEYNGMALSACYQDGRSGLSCLSCHTMHGDDPNFMLKPGMLTNEACYQCHGDYRGRLTEHTRHGADSPGSLCYNCHMPHLVYSLLTTHRSHRIESPDVKTTLETGKPHACNLCHLDKSLGWTQSRLADWSKAPRSRPVKLPADEEKIASPVLMLATGDARTRAMAAGAFSNPAAQLASGIDWFGSFLTRHIDTERYAAVRYLAHRALRQVHGEDQAGPFDYLAAAPVRVKQLHTLRERFDGTPPRRKLPHLPLTDAGLPDEEVLRRLLARRHDPELTINE